MRVPVLLLPSEQDFALADYYVIEGEAVFVRAGAKTGTDSSAGEADAWRSLQNI
jgi:hypothetical protein